RIAILGTGGIGKTSLARAVVHHQQIVARYDQHRFFVACDSAVNKAELVGLIGDHLGLNVGKGLTQRIVQHLTSGPPSVLILDNLETLWEPVESKGDVEEFLSLITDVKHLALVITMRGAERPSKVRWTRPFLQPLQPLEHAAARQTFVEIAGAGHNPKELDEVLLLAGNMPLAVDLLAHLVNSEGCSNILSRWKEERTLLISDGHDKKSNLDVSILLSLSSPRIISVPHTQDLLSLLSLLPDGLSNTELIQSKLPISNVLECKTALVRTAVAYTDEQQRLKVLVPIREYMHRTLPPVEYLVGPLLKYFQELLEFYQEFSGAQASAATVTRISLNFANIQNILHHRLQH
ncbi:hypothetical protein K438DRAFT_1442951, partial [Mycena galopus ATCC 62051]